MKKIICILGLLLVFIESNAQTTDWVLSFGGAASDKGISIGTDSLGFIYCSGFFNNEATFGSITLTNSPLSTWGNNKENFVFKMDSLGNVLWAIAGGNLSGSCCDDRALGMHVTPGGDVFITGTFWSSYNLGPLSVPGTQRNNHDNSLLAKIDKNGNPVWVIGFGSDNTSGGCPYPIYDADDHSYDVKVDKDGFIYVTGFFSGYSAEFDGLSVSNPTWNSTCTPMGYIGKLDSNGNWLWVDKFDGIKDDRGSRDNRLAIDQFSNIYVVGGFQGSGNYGPYSINSNGEWDAFIFKMDKNGNWLWVKNVGSNKTDRADGIAIDVCDDIYITGEYRNPMVFPGANASNGTDTLSHKQKRDVFVAKINANGDWQWAKRARSSGTDKPYQMSVDANKQVFIGGTAKGEMTFTNGLVVTPQIPGDTTASAWVAQLDGSTNTGDWVWAKMAGCDTDDDDRTGDICSDGFGNVYAIGFFEELANFDGTILDATGRRKDIFVWKMSMTPGSFTVNNVYDTIFVDSTVYNPMDSGISIISSFYINGCDTIFTDSVINKRYAVRVMYDVNPTGTATIDINGNTISAFPYTEEYFYGDAVNLSANINAGWYFNSWNSLNNSLNTNVTNPTNFFAANEDTIVLNINAIPPTSAFIYGGDSICDNSKENAQITIDFVGASPFTFVYAIDGIAQPSITTSSNPYIINTTIDGIYSLINMSDAAGVGSVNGSVSIVVYNSPIAIFNIIPDTVTINYPTAHFVDKTSGNIVDWLWNFGDNSADSMIANIFHTFPDSVGVYKITMIVTDENGCRDTTFNHLWVQNEFWIYLPNSFTPDLDGINDKFCLSYNGIRIETFNISIYDRNSGLVFSSNNIEEMLCELGTKSWDGTHIDSGEELPMGMYVYEIYFQDFQGWKHQDSGYIYLIR
jgi:gliding motility-associated-like protein